jgi:hypothetical protein
MDMDDVKVVIICENSLKQTTGNFFLYQKTVTLILIKKSYQNNTYVHNSKEDSLKF